MNSHHPESPVVTIRNSIQDYRSGRISLGTLIDEVEEVLNAAGNEWLKAGLFENLLALEEVFARTRIGDIDFERDGLSVVEKAIYEMWHKTEPDSFQPPPP